MEGPQTPEDFGNVRRVAQLFIKITCLHVNGAHMRRAVTLDRYQRNAEGEMQAQRFSSSLAIGRKLLDQLDSMTRKIDCFLISKTPDRIVRSFFKVTRCTFVVAAALKMHRELG